MIDVHVLTMPDENPQWLQRCLDSLKNEPVITHVAPGIEGNIGKARRAAFALGEQPFVSAVDPDDFVLPGCFSQALEIMENCPYVAGTYCFEYVVGEKLVLKEQSISKKPHHAIVFRRSVLESFLPILESHELVTTVKGVPWISGEWWALFSAISKEHVFMEIPHPLYVWRRHENSFTGKNTRRFSE